MSYIRRIVSIKKGLFIIGLELLLVCYVVCPKAIAAGIKVGGGANKVRVVFDLKYPLKPKITQKEQTLIVNFPDTVGEKSYIKDTLIVDKILFDGKDGQIYIKRPFTYTVSYLQRPPRFVIDISAEETKKSYCPIESINLTTPGDKVRIVFKIDHNTKLQILLSKDYNSLYLLFDRKCLCRDIGKYTSAIPYLEYMNTVEMEGGSAIGFTIPGEDKKFTARFAPYSQEVILDILLNGEITAEERYDLANKAYLKGDIATCIDLLKKREPYLSPKACVLLSRAYWKVSYPYGKKDLRQRALSLMGRGIEGLTPGIEREMYLAEYSKMFIRWSLFADAMKYIRFLKDSISDDIAIEARVLEMEVLNKQGLFDDAFIANKRMIKQFDPSAIPDRLKGYYISMLGDTYLGLNAYSKALLYYKEAIEKDAGLLQEDPSLYGRVADAAFNKADFKKARYYILKAINLGDQSQRLKYLLKQGDCLYQLGDIQGAIKIFSEVENLSPSGESGVIARLRRARFMMEEDLEQDQKLSDKAFYKLIDIYSTVLDEDIPGPLRNIVKIRQAQVYAEHGNWDDAFRVYYTAWVDTKKDDPVHAYAYAAAQSGILARLKLLAAQSGYNDIFDLYTQYQTSFLKGVNDPEVLFIIGRSLYMLGNFIEARPLLLACVKGNNSIEDEVLDLLFDIDYKQGRYTSALEWNTMYLHAYPKGKNVQRMKRIRGELLYRLDRLDEAVTFLEMTVNMQREPDIKPLSLLADAYHRLSMTDKEVRVLDKIIALYGKVDSPSIEHALYIRAGQLKGGGEIKGAERLYNNLIKGYDKSDLRWGAMYNLADIAVMEGDVDGAVNILNQITAQCGDLLWLAAARAYVSSIEMKASVSEFNKLRSRFKGD